MQQAIEIERLYEPPFTTFNAEGIDGVFDEALATELLDFISTFDPLDENPSRQEDAPQ